MFDLRLLFLWFYTSVALVNTMRAFAFFLSSCSLSGSNCKLQLANISCYCIYRWRRQWGADSSSGVWLCLQVTLPQDVYPKKCLSCLPQSGSAVEWVAKWIVLSLCCLVLLSLFFTSFHMFFKLRCTLPNVINVLQNSFSMFLHPPN